MHIVFFPASLLLSSPTQTRIGGLCFMPAVIVGWLQQCWISGCWSIEANCYCHWVPFICRFSGFIDTTKNNFQKFETLILFVIRCSISSLVDGCTSSFTSFAAFNLNLFSCSKDHKFHQLWILLSLHLLLLPVLPLILFSSYTLSFPFDSK